MNEIIVAFFLLFGVAFILLASIGLLRFPDIYMRISAVTKSATMGIASMLFAVMFHFWQLEISARILATIVFLFSTSPIASQMIGRAAYFIGVSMWIKSKTDEMSGQYNMKTHSLDSFDKEKLPFKNDDEDEDKNKK